MTGNTHTAPKNEWLKSAGVEVSDVGLPFFKTTSRPMLIRFIEAKPSGETKPLPGGGTITVLARFMVLVGKERVLHEWEVSAKRLMLAIAGVARPGADYEVWHVGNGNDRQFVVREVGPDGRPIDPKGGSASDAASSSGSAARTVPAGGA